MAVTNSSGTGTFGADTMGSTGTKRDGNGGHDEQHGLLDRVRDSATAQLSSQKDRAVDGLGSAARAVRQSTQQLREQDHETVASYVEQAADQIERLSQRLREKDLGDLLDDAQRLARRQPSLFVGTAFAIGLLGARFLKSSRDDDDDEYDDDYRRRYAPSSGFAGTRQAEDWRRGSKASAGNRVGVGGSTARSGLSTPGISTPGSGLSDPGHSSTAGATTDLKGTPGAASGKPSSESGSPGTSASSQSTRGRKGTPGSSGSDTERF